MILYTSMPHELIFPTEMNEYDKQKVVSYEGTSLLVEMTEGNNCTVLRVMSSDPADFMNEKFSPGAKITLT
ncbi:hypothetical protein J2Z40_000740 [Cytobacillus eiseniae]|uniref:Uncharacterized protein n=1 Tax=Cytobacillus eiseniae TaxID=762947 RepID=A0ABS4RBA6_9BACI|nr:YlzJ-like family protein [Cytobacillus eiseniae]MBP2240187.1 hypothetical protein [Cytobacillus eiseniae]